MESVFTRKDAQSGKCITVYRGGIIKIIACALERSTTDKDTHACAAKEKYKRERSIKPEILRVKTRLISLPPPLVRYKLYIYERRKEVRAFERGKRIASALAPPEKEETTTKK